MGNKVRRNNWLESLLQKDKENTRSKTEMVPDQIITQDFSNQYCVCDFCNLERDSIQLCMWRCQHVKSFWNKLEEFIYDHCDNVRNFKFNANNYYIAL